MKKVAVAMVILLCCLPLFGQKTRYGQGLPKAASDVDYSIKSTFMVYISGHIAKSMQQA